MKTAKIITFIALILNSLQAVTFLYLFLNIRQTFQNFEAQMQPKAYLVFLIPIMLVIASFIYLIYLRNKQRREEKVKFALLISSALLLIPSLIMPVIIINCLLIQLYELPAL